MARVGRQVAPGGLAALLSLVVVLGAGSAAAQAPDAGTPADAAAAGESGSELMSPTSLEEGEDDTPASATAEPSAATPPASSPSSASTPTTNTRPLPRPRETARTDASHAPRRAPATERALDEDAEEDEDRFRFAYLEASAGYSWINLAVIKKDNFVPEFQTIEGNGFCVGGGAGFFISFLTLGLQAEWANHAGFDVGTVAFDVGIRIPTPVIEPYLRAGVGYAWLFNMDAVDPSTGNALWMETPSIRGVVVDIGLGFDFMLSHLVAIGVGVDTALFNVSRSGGDPTNPGMVSLEEDGDAVGVQVSALLQLNLHF